ncbi:MAG TPA: undecaprenyl-diphosphate phosphatase [Planctomycetaceae bacterium]|nr:undecaprenyl-diphosphate phosphatase [Planctomycetaceae bacterium]
MQPNCARFQFGTVILAERIMGMDPSRPEQVFLLVMLHTGTMFALLVYFWPRWRRLWRNEDDVRSGERESARQFLTMVILATVATGVVALGAQVRDRASHSSGLD